MILLRAISAIIWLFSAVFGIFFFWVLWIISKSLKGVDESLKEIAHKMQGPS
jgi:hypothetical protein